MLPCCCFPRRQEREIIATTPQKPEWAVVGETVQLKTVYSNGGGMQTDEEFRFQFRRNPVIDNVHPLEAIAEWVTLKCDSNSSSNSTACTACHNANIFKCREAYCYYINTSHRPPHEKRIAPSIAQCSPGLCSLYINRLWSGGIQLTFSGKYLDSVAHPVMVTTAVLTLPIPESSPPEYNTTKEKYCTVGVKYQINLEGNIPNVKVIILSGCAFQHFIEKSFATFSEDPE